MSSTLRELRLENVRTYLIARGWKHDRAGYDRAEVWFLEERPDHEIILPSSETVLDLNARLVDALQTISRVEDRLLSQIVTDIQSARADIIRLRRALEGGSSTIQLAEGVDLVDHAMTLVTAAASAAVTPRAVVPSRRPLLAQKYLSRVHLGQTEVGSYVLTIHSPLEAVEEQMEPALFPELSVPFARRVMVTLSKALASVRDATAHARSSGDFEVFERAVPNGVSANLCEAIAGLIAPEERAAPLGISLTWAPSDVAPPPANAFEFLPDEVDVLREAASRFRAAEPPVDALISGTVVGLLRDDSDLERRVTVACFIDGKGRKLRVPLGPADYQKAIEAHRDKAPVLFRADLEQIGRMLVATNVREWRVLS